MSPGLTLPEGEITHILDLPPLHSSPSYPLLHATLTYFTPRLSSWDPTAPPPPTPPPNFSKWLLRVITSPPSNLTPDEIETLQTLASSILSSLCGRSCAPPQSRTFKITADVNITLHEPTLTGDSLGHKTWGSAYTLARRLPWLQSSGLVVDISTVLELGAGTGLVGIAAAKIWPDANRVVVTDMEEIVDNLGRNVGLNGGGVEVEVLNWVAVEERWRGCAGTVLVADPIYDKDHPALVVGAVEVVMRRGPEARCVVEMPVREGYAGEREEFRRMMEGVGLRVLREGREEGRDDWGNGEEEGVVWWSVWAWGEGVVEVGVGMGVRDAC